MGCDGGTIPRRDELVKVQKKPPTNDNKDLDLAFRWHCCHLSQQTLQSPIVMCGHGHLYSKVALIEALLNRDSLPDSIRHIRSLKDVKNVSLTPNPEHKLDSQTAPYICPVTGSEMMGKLRFVGLWSCGCVFSERALKEIGAKLCHKCQTPYVDEDVVIINGNGTDLATMRQNTAMRQQRSKKGKKVKIEVNATSDKQTADCKISINRKQSPIKRKGTGGVLKNKNKQLKMNYSVAKDPRASDVYKSLFTSHQSEQQQTRAHWITYNPFYN